MNIFIQSIEKLSFQMTKRGRFTAKRPGRVNNPGRVKHSSNFEVAVILLYWGQRSRPLCDLVLECNG